MWLPLLAVTRAAAQSRFLVERLTPEQGLSQSYVYAIAQDRFGFLWFATRDGLSRYDGYQFTVLRRDPYARRTLLYNCVPFMATDATGDVWMWALERINRLEHRSLGFSTYPPVGNAPGGAALGMVKFIVGDGRGNVWFACERGLTKYDRAHDAFIRPAGVPASPGNVQPSMALLYVDARDRVWYAFGNGVIECLDQCTGRVRMYGVWPHMYEDCRVLREEPDGRLVFGVGSVKMGRAAIATLDPETGEIEHYPRFTGNAAWAKRAALDPRCVDAAGNLWFSVDTDGGNTDSEGLYAMPLDTLLHGRDLTQRLRQWQVLRREQILSLKLDHSGVMWCGTMNGAYRIVAVEHRFITYGAATADRDGLSCPRVRTIRHDAAGRLWVGTDFGVNIYDEQQRRWDRVTALLGHGTSNESAINTIECDADSSMLLGTNGLLLRYDPRTRRFSPKFRADRRDQTPKAVWSILRDSTGDLWVGTREDGLFRYDRNDRLRACYTSVDGDSTSILRGLIWALHRDRNGVLWIATSGGICRWIPERNAFRRYVSRSDDPRTPVGDNVCAITEDARGNLWFTAHGAGISRYDRATDSFTRFSLHEGLPTVSLYATVADARGLLWISSNAGLLHYDPATHACRTYNAGDGIQGNEFTFVAYDVGPTGELFFGGANGVTRFHPESLRDNPVPPRMAITAFRVFDTLRRVQLDDGDTIVVDRTSNFLSFDFAALDYHNPTGNRYAYMLEGLTDAWISCGTRHTVSFNSLEPGFYRLRVTGSNNDGVWAVRPITIVIDVVPPYWMTWWFKTAAALAVVAALCVGIVARVRAVRTAERRQRRQVESELHALRLQINPHFIFNALGSIQHLILKHEPHRAVEYLTRFARLVRATLENSRRTFVAVGEEVENLRHYLMLEARRFDGRFNWRIDVDPSIDPAAVALPTMLMQPLVENAIRHGLLRRAEGGSVSVSIVRDGEMLRCTIEDDGVGRAHAGRSSSVHGAECRRSYGLVVTRERIEMLRALTHREVSITITDLHDAAARPTGTRVELLLPAAAAGDHEEETGPC